MTTKAIRLGGSGPPIPVLLSTPNVGRSYYIDAVNGSDKGEGTEASPYATITKALVEAGPFIVNDIRLIIAPTNDPSGYDMSEFYAPRIIVGSIIVEGIGREYLTDSVEVDSEVENTLDLTTASPGWTPNEWRGWHVELSQSNGVVLHSTIWGNSANEMVICGRNWSGTTDSLRVAVPAVVLNLEREDYKGIIGSLSLSRPGAIGPSVIFNNIHMRASTSGSIRTRFRGGFVGVGLIISCRVAAGSYAGDVTIKDGSFISGTYANSYLESLGFTDEEMNGYGLSFVNTGGSYGLPVLLVKADWYGSFVGGAAHFTGGHTAIQSNGWFSGGRASIDAGFYASVYVDNGTYAWANDSYNKAYGVDGGAHASYQVEELGSFDIISPPVVDESQGLLAEVRGGHLSIQTTFSFPNRAGGAPANEAGLEAIMGGTIEMDNDGSTILGTSTISSTNPLVRPASSFAPFASVADMAVVFTDLPTDGGSAIFRR